MPHQRSRTLLQLLKKRLSLFPVTGVLGARQTGKSTLLRELLPKTHPLHYITLDREENRALAMRQPTLFIKNLENEGKKTVCIDEVQKAPTLFDTIKAEVDEMKRPGRFLLSGSTEFSRKTGIQESLTGRISLLRLFPLNLSEIMDLKPRFAWVEPGNAKNTPKSHLKEVSLWLERGGMPGIFAVREKENRDALFESWIETTCTRDLAQFKIPRFNPDLARRILSETAKLKEPTRLEISRAVGRTTRQIENYLQAFKSLFVFYEAEPHPSSVGKSWFFLFDAGIAKFAGADSDRCLSIWFLNECLSQFSYSGESRPDIFRYETTRGSKLDFIVQSKHSSYAVKLTHEEAPTSYLLRAPEAFSKKQEKIPVLVLAPCLDSKKITDRIKIIPWSHMI